MPFDLTVATKRDPSDGRSSGAAAPRVTYATIGLSGTLSSRSIEAVNATIAKCDGDGSESIVVEVNDVRIEDEHSLHAFASDIMAFRARGVHVQVAVRGDSLYGRMAELPDARDWLVLRDAIDPSAPRKAIHVDPPVL